MTDKQREQFNIMLATLRKISKEYQTASQIRRNSEKMWGCSFEEGLEMAYENIQYEAKEAVKGVRAL